MMWNSTVEQFEGTKNDQGENLLTHVHLKNTQTGDVKRIECNGAFVAIGHDPNTKILKNTGVDMDGNGYVKTFLMGPLVRPSMAYLLPEMLRIRCIGKLLLALVVAQ